MNVYSIGFLGRPLCTRVDPCKMTDDHGAVYDWLPRMVRLSMAMLHRKVRILLSPLGVEDGGRIMHTLETSEMCRSRYISVVLDQCTQHSRHEVSRIRLTTGSKRKRLSAA